MPLAPFQFHARQLKPMQFSDTGLTGFPNPVRVAGVPDPDLPLLMAGFPNRKLLCNWRVVIGQPDRTPSAPTTPSVGKSRSIDAKS